VEGFSPYQFNRFSLLRRRADAIQEAGLFHGWIAIGLLIRRNETKT